jgi:hypothetical protein
VGMATACVGADASSAPLAKRAFGSNVKARTPTRTNSSKALSSPLRASRATPDEASGATRAPTTPHKTLLTPTYNL